MSDKPDETGIVLLGRSGYGQAGVQLRDLVKVVRAETAYRFVDAVFVDQDAPSLPDLLDARRSDGVTRVIVVPVYFPVDRALEAWLAQVVRRWVQRHAPLPFDVFLTSNVAVTSEFSAALVAVLRRADSDPGVPLEPSAVRANSPAWSVIPPAHQHVLVCRGPRCTAAGAGRTAARLSECLKREHLGDDNVLVAQTGCLYPCNLGPLMVVYPDGVWYGGLNEQAVERIVSGHFVGGRVVEPYARRPGPEAQQRPTSALQGESDWEDTL